MQDRFKFRIFDKKLNKMSNWGDNPYHNMEIVNMMCSDNPEYNSNDNFHIMQCTGLKDKNGKLIFEGDIVRVNNKEVYTVEWLQSYCAFHMEGYECVETFFANTYEVIGNVYEHKYLIED